MIGIHYFLGVSLAILVTIFTIGSDKKNLKTFFKYYVKRLFNEPAFAFVTLGTFAFSGYIFSLKDDSDNTKHLQKATRDALIGYIIALFAFFNLTLLPFWIIWFTTYYSVL